VSKRNRTDEEPPTPAPDLAEVVAAYAAQAAAADELAEVDTERLDTPTANPNALATLNVERDTTARERIQLDFERERLVARDEHQVLLDQIAQRRHRATATTARSERAVGEGLADADEATEQLATIREFEAEASPAASATALTRAVKGWRREEFVNAIIGSALSAVGIAALLVAVTSLTWWTAPVVAAAAEVVLTMRVVRLISQRATLAERHKGQKLSKEGSAALVFMGRQIIALLVVSVLVNVAGLIVATGWLGLIGVLGALAAAVSSWSAATVSVAVTETVRSNVDAWQGGNWEAARADLRARAAGAHIPDLAAPVRQERGLAQPDQAPVAATVVDVGMVRQVLATLADEHIAALAGRGTDDLQELLKHARSGSSSSGSATPGSDADHPLAEGVATPDEQDDQPALEGNRLKIWQAIQQHGVDVSNRRLAELTGLARGTVRTHRTALWHDGHTVFDPTKVNDS
jgi:hypothetical protein